MIRGSKIFILAASCVLLILVASGLSEGAQPPKASTRLASVSSTVGNVPFANLRGRTLYLANGQSRPLGGTSSGALMGWVSPIGVVSPDGSQVAYNAWSSVVTVDPLLSASDQHVAVGDVIGTPSIRIVDTSSGVDSQFADGAYSLAWRSDGTIAYVRGQSAAYRFSLPYSGDIVVRPPGAGTEQTWSLQPDRYIVAAWAGNTLLAYREGPGEILDLLAFDGPNQERTLGSHTILISVSPDGTQALVFDGGASVPTVRLLDIATGTELSSTDLFSAVPAGQTLYPHFLGYGGDWSGEYVVAESDVGLVRLRIVGGVVSVTEILAFDSKTFPIAPHEPQFIQGSDSQIQAWAPTDSNGVRTYRFVTCDFATGHCNAGAVGTIPGFAEVHNPSEP